MSSSHIDSLVEGLMYLTAVSGLFLSMAGAFRFPSYGPPSVALLFTGFFVTITSVLVMNYVTTPTIPIAWYVSVFVFSLGGYAVLDLVRTGSLALGFSTLLGGFLVLAIITMTPERIRTTHP